ncbi:hypothetical protein E2C01_054544 [Portunus trituberculatus]|uniref:Uncharacterized protein n=1 Tax=Portunus trituberculatus TaxID=210409 RepID=A0A5B7GTZ6_PORTR|nr:hypothetical protein [Portunus trituberculatus]
MLTRCGSQYHLPSTCSYTAFGPSFPVERGFGCSGGVEKRSVPPPSPARVATGASPSPRPPRVNDGAGPSHGLTCPASPVNFLGFGEAGSDVDVASVPRPTVGPLLQSAKVFGPPEVVSDAIDDKVAEMVNFLFDRGLREDDHKALFEDECVLRPSNCPALSAVECSPEVLDALPLEARRLDFHMKEVNKDVLRAATIITRSLLALDKVAQDEEHPVMVQEVAMINSALALLGNANFRNNLARRFVLKHELNQKFTHLCSEKVPMTRFLFDDDVSKSVKQIEESVKLKSTITAKKPSFSWRFPGGKTRGSGHSALARGFSSVFCLTGSGGLPSGVHKELPRCPTTLIQKTPGAGAPSSPGTNSGK